MKWRQIIVIALLFVLVFSLSGCSLVSQLTSATATQTTSVGNESQTTPTAKVASSTTSPTAQVTEADTSVPSGDTVDPNSLQTLNNLDSYHMIQNGQFTDIQTDTTVSTSTIDMEVWETKAPQARHVIYRGSQTGNPESSLEFIQIANDSYMKSSDSSDWLAMSTSTTDTLSFGSFAWFTDPASAMQGEATLIGTENVNGMAAKHYQYTGAQVFGKVVGANGKVDISQADIWISTEFNLIVRYVSHWKGTDDTGVQSDYNFIMDILEVNTPITIEAPSGVTKAGLPDDVPLMDAATDINAFSGLVSYKVTATVDEVMAFYASALAKNGWTAGEDQGTPGIAAYTKDTRTLTLMASDDNGATTVTIMIQAQGQ
jgi:uncharacterized protein YceK